MKKILCFLVILPFLVAFVQPSFAATRTSLSRVDGYLEVVQQLPWRPRTSVNIRNIPSGDPVYSNVLIIAQVTGSFATVVYQIDTGSQYPMSRVGSTNRFQATWDTTTVSAGSHTLCVKAKDSSGNVVGSDSVSITVVTAYRWELYCEIDYVIGHEPPQSVLDYVQNYWKGHAIKVSFLIDDAVSDPTPADGYISDNDFWTLENQYNDVWMYDDRSFGGSYPKYTLKEKWMLYGTWTQYSNVGGYTYVTISGSDCLAGNYIFIADSMIDNWEASNSIPSEGGEVIVVAHECGHSIGIAKLFFRSELYDSDYYSIMSTMRLENAKYMTNCWYYSKEYWVTANLGYYAI